MGSAQEKAHTIPANNCLLNSNLFSCLISYSVIFSYDVFCALDYILTTSEAATGVAPCLVGENGSSAIVIVSGANLLLTPDEVNQAEDIIKKSKVMVCQLEIKQEATITALRLAKKHGGMLVKLLSATWYVERSNL